jgi:hypothetical protein
VALGRAVVHVQIGDYVGERARRIGIEVAHAEVEHAATGDPPRGGFRLHAHAVSTELDPAVAVCVLGRELGEAHPRHVDLWQRHHGSNAERDERGQPSTAQDGSTTPQGKWHRHQTDLSFERFAVNRGEKLDALSRRKRAAF